MATPDITDYLKALTGIDQSAEQDSPWTGLVSGANDAQKFAIANSPKANFGQALLGGILTGAMSGVADRAQSGYVEDQQKQAQDAIDSWRNGKTFDRGSMSSSVFNKLKDFTTASDMAKQAKEADEAAQLKQQQDLKMSPTYGQTTEVNPALIEAFTKLGADPEKLKGLNSEQANTLQELLSTKARIDALPTKDDLSKTKLEDTLRKEWEAPKAQAEITATKSLLDSVRQLKNLKTPIGSLAMAELFNRIQAPGANAIRGSVLEKTMDAQNPLNKIQGDVQKFFGGDSLAPESAKQLVDVIETVAGDRMNYYKNQADSKYRSIAKNRDLDFNNIIPEYDSIFGDTGSSNTTSSEAPPGMSFEQFKAWKASKK